MAAAPKDGAMPSGVARSSGLDPPLGPGLDARFHTPLPTSTSSATLAGSGVVSYHAASPHLE